MRILGIKYTAGSAETQKILTEGLEVVFRSVQEHQSAEEDPEILFWTGSFDQASAIPKPLLTKIKHSQLVLLAAPALDLDDTDDFVNKLAELDKDDDLRGKWMGLVVHGTAHPYQTRQYTDRVMGSCNRANMLLIPNGVARSTHDNEFTEHVILGHNAAIALSSMSEWKGRTAWQEQQAA